MYSFDFEELLWAKGYDGIFIDDLSILLKYHTLFDEVMMPICEGFFRLLYFGRDACGCAGIYCRGGLPIKGNYDETRYKIYFADSGLLVAMLNEEAQEDLQTNRNHDVYEGALYENIVGEALAKSGYTLWHKIYWKKYWLWR